MKVLILGAGAQGKAAIYDLLQNKDISEIMVVENNPEQIEEFLSRFGDDRINVVSADANDHKAMLKLFEAADVVVDLLPTMFRKTTAKLAIDSKTNLVNTSFQSNIKEYENDADVAGIMIMPEAGLDPGIDLILAGHAVKVFDTVLEFQSACGGLPAPEACDNPINYKISWNFEGVLSAYKRPANLIVDGERFRIPGDKIFDYSEEIEIKGVGRFDRYPNGFSSTYARLLGIEGNVKNMGRYTLRWPGHSAFWKKLVDLGMIDEEPLYGMSPKKYIAKLLSSRLKYKDDERDMIVLRNDVVGVKEGKKMRLVQQVVDYRDMKTGFMAMNRTVGFTASIITQMILDGRIKGKGVLNPCKDVPYTEFMAELKKRGIEAEESLEAL